METEAQPSNIIKETDYVLVIENRGNRVISNIRKEKTVNFRRKKLKLKDFVGHPYGSTFEIAKNGDIKLISNAQAEEPFEEDGSADEDEKEDETTTKTKEDVNDNRDMVDNNKAQKLTQAEIDQMKKQGVEGQEIIDRLLENSESFNKRTEFSKEKYLLKKKKKHLFQVKVEKITLDSLVETYFLKNQSYILNFRYDSLALFLQMAGIVPRSKILLFDNTHGLVLGGVRQRLGDEGEIHVCSPRVDKQTIQEFRILNELGYTADDLKNISLVALKDLEANPTKFSHLLVASEINPMEILAATMDYIQGGGTIVIFNQFLEPLGDCFEYLRQPPLAINMFIKEVFSREMQVLPERSHPFMMMSAYSGFILSGNRVLS